MGDVPQRGPGAARFVVLIGAIIVQLILGTVYGYSIFWQPLTAEIFPEVITEVGRISIKVHRTPLVDPDTRKMKQVLHA